MLKTIKYIVGILRDAVLILMLSGVIVALFLLLSSLIKLEQIISEQFLFIFLG